MKTAKRQRRKAARSAHSQRTRLRILGLGTELKKTLDQIAFLERRRKQAQEISKSQTGTALRSAVIGRFLSETLEKIGDYERQIKAFQEHAASLRQQIGALENPSKAQKAARGKAQDALKRLLLARKEVDDRLDGLNAAMRGILETRAGSTAKITEVAGVLEFAPEVDLDGSRFTELLFSLPVEITESSRKWLDAFLGTEKGKQAHIIGEKPFIVPETLAHCGVFLPGEQAFLTEAQAALLAADGPEKPLPTPMEWRWSWRQAIGKRRRCLRRLRANPKNLITFPCRVYLRGYKKW